jgi:NADPH-dependent curcumin reductase CurA
MSTSRQFRLAARPVGELKASDWELVEAPVPRPGDGEFVVEVTHISLDPAMRGWMSAARSYVPPVEIGEVMRALTLGRVLDSRHARFASVTSSAGRSASRSTRSRPERAFTRSPWATGSRCPRTWASWA